VSKPVAEALAARSIDAPFIIQSLVVPDALAGEDILAKSPTGSGKTLAFGLPIVERLDPRSPTPAALVLVPTRELASQVADDIGVIAAAKGMKVTAVYGGVSMADQAKRVKTAQILVATPGRLEDLVSRRLVSLAGVTILVLDEADRMLDMGFQPQVDRLVRRLPSDRQTMLFSATLDGEVGRIANSYTRDPRVHEAGLPPAREQGEVDHHFIAVTADSKLDKLIELLTAERGLALIFVRTKRGADRLARKLAAAGIPSEAMHGDKTQAAREKALARFESGRVTTLVATDVAARGLDLSEITHVINFDPPTEDKGYVHRVGRTGRAGRNGTGITLVLPDQQEEVSRVAARLGHTETFESSGMSVAQPRLVYSGRGRGSKWGKAPASRRA
jgi:superfamily II DNA/RNA helicase